MNIIYNPLGATKGHTKIYATGIVIGFMLAGEKIRLVTSEDYDTKYIETLMKENSIESNLLEIVPIKNKTSTITPTNDIAGKWVYSYKLLYNTISGFRVLNKVMHRGDRIYFIGGNTLLNIIGINFLNNQKYFGLTIHNVDFESNDYTKLEFKKYYKLAMRMLIKRLIKKDHVRIFVHGNYTKRILADQLKVNSGYICSYDVPIIVSNSSEGNILTPVGTKFTILFFGVIRYDKGLDFLVSTLNQIQEVSIELRICGSIEHVGIDYVKSLLANLDRQHSAICHLGYVNDDRLEEEFVNATYVILPYRKTFKAQSVVFADAVKRYKPVICTKESQNGDYTMKYQLGEVFESENIEDCKKAILRAHSKFKSGEMSETGQFRNFLKTCSPLRVAQEMMAE